MRTISAASLLMVRPGQASVLMVEDEFLIRCLVCEVMRDAGYTVIEAVDADEALSEKALRPGCRIGACQERAGTFGMTRPASPSQAPLWSDLTRISDSHGRAGDRRPRADLRTAKRPPT